MKEKKKFLPFVRLKERKKFHFCNVRTVPTALALVDRLITKIPDEELRLQLGYAYQCISFFFSLHAPLRLHPVSVFHAMDESAN